MKNPSVISDSVSAMIVNTVSRPYTVVIRILRQKFVMFVLQLVFVLLIQATGWGQIFTKVAYQFPDHPCSIVANTQLTFSCLTSNGIGNWFGTSSKQSWYLYADTLPSQSPATAGIIASGTLNSEFLAYTEEIKVTSNLAGNIRYVWPKYNDQANRTSFSVRGLNDERDIDPTHRQVDISLNGIPNEANSRNIIKGDITSYPDVQTNPNFPVNSSIGGGFGSSDEIDWRDNFDICCDSVFLYITWESFHPPAGGGTNFFQTWVTVVRLSDGQVVTPITGHPNWNFPKMIWTNGRRPTIDCDKRNSDPNIHSFIIADIDDQSKIAIYHFEDGNGNISSVLCPQLFQDPNNSGTPNAQNVKHVRAVVGSAYRSLVPITGVYGIVNGAQSLNSQTGDDIVFWKFNNHVPMPAIAEYVDGLHNMNHALPIGIGAFPIINSYIQGFTNPYDGEADDNFDEFHCLYQLDKDATFSGKPLLICRGAGNNLERNIITRNGNTLIGSPSKNTDGQTLNGSVYLASVNQSGIHIFWVGVNSASNNIQNIYYLRDYRVFDEPIEENTLLTYFNKIGDGTSHGQTMIGAQLQPGRTLTFWTDPNWNNGILYVGGQTLGYNNARLLFSGLHTTLEIGRTAVYDPTHTTNPNGYLTTSAKFVTPPNFEIWFQDQCTRDHDQKILLNGGSTWEYYGVPSDLSSNFFNAGKIQLAGSQHPFLDPEQQSSLPPLSSQLRIHGGATLVVPNQVKLDGTDAVVHALFEPQIRTISSTVNPYETGVLRVHGEADFDHCEVLGHQDPSIDNNPFVDYIQIMPKLPLTSDPCTQADPQFSETHSLFLNTPDVNLNTPISDQRVYDVGVARIVASGNTSTSSYRSLTFSNGYLNNVLIDADNSVNPITIDGTTITEIQNVGVVLHRSLGLAYGNIHIQNATFNMHCTSSGALSITGFSNRRLSQSTDKILVDNNTFATLPDFSISGPPQYQETFTWCSNVPFAVDFENSSGKISNNTVTSGYYNGIIVNGTNDVNTNSFLCSNTISSCSNAGISNTYWDGYGRLNNVYNSQIGHLFGNGAARHPCHINYSSYHDCFGPGLKVISDNALSVLLDHLNDGVYDNAGFNTIAYNNSSGSSTTGQIEFAGISGSEIELDYWTGSSLSDYAHNNIITNGNGDFFAYAPNANGGELVSPDDNFWATGQNATYYGLINSDPLIHNVAYNTVAHLSQNQNTFSGISCGDGYATITHPKDFFPSSENINCDSLLNSMDKYLFNNSRIAYDTGRFYTEHCYADSVSYQIFGAIGDACNQLEELHDTVWGQYRAWLKSVAHLNPSKRYYCSDLTEYAHTFSHKDELGHPEDIRTSIAIYGFLSDSLHCFGHSLVSDYIREYHNYFWQDTVKDSLKTPFDSTILSLDQVGETFIRGFVKSGVAEEHLAPANLIAEFSAIQNPFKDELELHYKLNRENLVRIEIYDVLGKLIWSDGQGYLPPKESSSVKIDTKNWQSGTYYTRLSTFSNETKTVKLIHEK